MSLNAMFLPKSMDDVVTLSTNKWPENLSNKTISRTLNNAEIVIKKSDYPDVVKIGFCTKLLTRASESNLEYGASLRNDKQKLCIYLDACTQATYDCRFSHCTQMVNASKNYYLGKQSKSSPSSSSSISSAPKPIHLALNSKAVPFVPKSALSSNAMPFVPKYVSSSSSSSLSSSPVGSSAAPVLASSEAAAPPPVERFESHDSVL